MEDVRKYLEEGRAIDLFVAYRFLRILTTPWEDQDAYKLGIIDKDGKLLRKHNELKTSEEKESFTLLHRLIFNLKRILHKIPGVRTKIGTYATALYLLKQHMASDEEQERMIEKAFYNYLIDNGLAEQEEIDEADSSMQRAMKDREKNTYDRQKDTLTRQHKRKMDRLGDRISRREKASGAEQGEKDSRTSLGKQMESKKEKEPKEKVDSKTIQRWSVWTQGPDDALEKKMKRQYKNTTPGQERDYAKLVGNRKFQKFEEVEEVKLQDEDAVANAVAHGGVDMAPNAKGTKVWLKRKRKSEIDGRTKAYRKVTKRIKERNTKTQTRAVEKKLGLFGVISNPFKEEAEMDNKYLETKKDSIEDAVTQSVEREFINPNTGRTTLTLPTNRYLKSKDGSIVDAVESIMTENKPSDKEVRMAKGIANDPRHKAGDMTGAWKKAEKIKKGLGDHPKVAKALRKANEESEFDETSGEKEQKSKMNRRQKKWDHASKDDSLDGVDQKELKGKWKDREDKDIDNDGDKDDSDKYLHKRRKAISKDIKDQDKDPVGKKHESKESSLIAAAATQIENDVKEVWKKDVMKKPASGVEKGFRDKDKEKKARADKRTWPKDYRAKKNESKEVERGERDVASNAYTNYVKSLTPGEKPQTNITDVDAAKSDVKQKKEKAQQNRQATVIDDELSFESIEQATDWLTSEDYATPRFASNLTNKELGRKAAASRKLRRTTQQKARDNRKTDTGYTRGFSRAK